MSALGVLFTAGAPLIIGVQIPDGPDLRRFRRPLHLGQQLLPAPAFEACRCCRTGQCLFATRQRRRIVCDVARLSSGFSNFVVRYIWPSAWGPTYRNSYAICISCAGCTIIMCYLFRLHLAYLNRRLDEEEEEKKKRKDRFIGSA